MFRDLTIFVLMLFSLAHATGAEWQPAQAPLMTRWAAEVSPTNALPEYPRPQFVREAWQNLNGLWEYAIRPKAEDCPETFAGQILVPFAAESALSGVMKPVGPEQTLWYRRTFTAPALDNSQRLRLHFGAVDWQARVWVNQQLVGDHQGGYDAFWFDITDALRDEGDQEIVVRVWDPVDNGFQPRGKQVIEPQGIWYTSVTGIWRTVWLEPVPAARIESLKLTPDVDQQQLRVDAAITVPSGSAKLTLLVRDGAETVSEASLEVSTSDHGASVVILLPIKNAKLWSPDTPFLYDLQAKLERDGKPSDEVQSYFGMRKIEVRKASDGFQRLFLNNQPLFHFGPLDQGWWPDGLYTAPTDEALRHDIDTTKKLGFNACRKHVKVEPDRWYYWCDKLGLLVWQDMPNGDRHIRREDSDLQRSADSAANYRREYQALIDTHYNHPCIVIWVPFNEGWGQFETKEILAWTRQYDPSRLVDGPSGWSDRGTGDMHDIHSYPGPDMPEPEEERAVVLGEFGGLGLPMEGHLWWNKRNWGYRTYDNVETLRDNYDQLMTKLLPLIRRGLAAAIYTQTTDVEGEVNGLMTYDREVIKFDPEHVSAIHAEFYKTP